MDGLLHVREVEVGKIVAGAVIVGMEAEAGDGLGDHALFGQSVIIRTLEELLLWMRISHQLGAMLRQFRAQVTALITGKPEFIRFYRGVRTSDHLKFQVSDDVFERHRRMLKK